jgi:acyl-coenzyme A thioesterase PaaI-like protein
MRCGSCSTPSAGAARLRTRSAPFAAQIREGREQLGRTARVASGGEGDGKPFLPGMEDFLDRSPITGQANPLAPPAVLRRDMAARRVTGEVTFGAAFEGAPGIVHGGFVAALLDEALGMATIFSGSTGMTVELVTRYRRHTPVATPLRLEARLVSTEGRRIRTAGELLCGDDVIAEARGCSSRSTAENSRRSPLRARSAARDRAWSLARLTFVWAVRDSNPDGR